MTGLRTRMDALAEEATSRITLQPLKPLDRGGRNRGQRFKLGIVLGAVAVVTAVIFVPWPRGGQLVKVYHGPPATAPSHPLVTAPSSSCALVPARQVAQLLQTSTVTATRNGPGCYWTSPVAGRTALISAQHFDNLTDARTLFGADESNNADSAQPWNFGDDAYVGVHTVNGVHATAVALVGHAVIIADVNGLATPDQSIAAAKSLVMAVTAALSRAWGLNAKP